VGVGIGVVLDKKGGSDNGGASDGGIGIVALFPEEEGLVPVEATCLFMARPHPGQKMALIHKQPSLSSIMSGRVAGRLSVLVVPAASAATALPALLLLLLLLLLPPRRRPQHEQ